MNEALALVHHKVLTSPSRVADWVGEGELAKAECSLALGIFRMITGPVTDRRHSP